VLPGLEPGCRAEAQAETSLPEATRRREPGPAGGLIGRNPPVVARSPMARNFFQRASGNHHVTALPGALGEADAYVTQS